MKNNRRYFESSSFLRRREAVLGSSCTRARPWTEPLFRHRADDCRITNALDLSTVHSTRLFVLITSLLRDNTNFLPFQNFPRRTFSEFSFPSLLLLLFLETKRARRGNRAEKSGVDSLEQIHEGQQEVDYRITDVEWKLKRAIERKEGWRGGGKKKEKKKRGAKYYAPILFVKLYSRGETGIRVS